MVRLFMRDFLRSWAVKANATASNISILGSSLFDGLRFLRQAMKEGVGKGFAPPGRLQISGSKPTTAFAED